MAVTFNYPNAYANCVHVYRATGGGVTFSANLAGTAVFDYFDNAAVVNDAIYFSSPGANSGGFANLKVNVGTAIAGTGITGVWEYRTLNGWETCHDLTDPTAGFTVTGANTIIFPVQAGMSVDYSVNGVATYGWIRYRITAITTITEGGANQTSAPQVGDGYFTINGGTDATPATFEDVYNYVVASAPEIGASKPASSIYKFNNMRINIASRLKTTNEQVFIGNGCAGGHLIYYLEAGTKVGTDGWKDHSSIFFCTRLGTNCLVTSAGNTKFYGGVLGSFNNYVNGYQRTFNSYLGITYGEWIGVSVFNRSGYFTNLTCNKCTVQGGLITSPFPASYPTNLRISDPGAYIWAIYSSGGTINNVSYALPTACIFNWNQYGAEGITINFVNPTPVLPAQA
ncbi:hypothetical protein M1437_03265 [Patescibacteria group bacterium]|nr:hypothetical protein [Patescibacteria group bacterium]